MMVTGYAAYSVKIIDDKGYSQLSSLVVRILNPFLMISGVLGKRIAFSPITSFVNYLGESCIVLSMIVVGAFLAKTNLKQVFFSKQNMLFVFVFMFLVPLLMVVVSKRIQCNTNIGAVFGIMACMPVGSATCMFAQEYGGDGTEAAHIVASTTISTIITAPLVFYLANFF